MRCTQIPTTRAYGFIIGGSWGRVRFLQYVFAYNSRNPGPGDDKNVLEREIAIIQELLDEQSDSKCQDVSASRRSLSLMKSIGCMESLVHYKRLLLKNHHSSVDASSLTSDCRRLLSDLRVLDPARRRRYEEIGASVS